MQKLLIDSYFWANYSISLQKSPPSNILPVGYMTILISRPVHDPLRPSCDPLQQPTTPAQNLGLATPQTLPGLTPLIYINDYYDDNNDGSWFSARRQIHWLLRHPGMK